MQGTSVNATLNGRAFFTEQPSNASTDWKITSVNIYAITNNVSSLNNMFALLQFSMLQLLTTLFFLQLNVRCYVACC